MILKYNLKKCNGKVMTELLFLRVRASEVHVEERKKPLSYVKCAKCIRFSVQTLFRGFRAVSPKTDQQDISPTPVTRVNADRYLVYQASVSNMNTHSYTADEVRQRTSPCTD